jgi:hypothetical protein
MNARIALLSGLGIGASLMYWFDPALGNQRRALARNRMRQLRHDAEGAVGATSRDLGNRARGVAAEAGAWFHREPVSDAVVVARVRERLGFLVSHPGAIMVTASQGRVTLRGLVRADEVRQVLDGVAEVRGVAEVENRLDVRRQADDASSPQGSRRRGPRSSWLQVHWSPTARLLAGVVGGACMACGASRRDLPGLALSSVGAGLVMRGLTNMELQRLAGLDGYWWADGQRKARHPARRDIIRPLLFP